MDTSSGIADLTDEDRRRIVSDMEQRIREIYDVHNESLAKIHEMMESTRKREDALRDEIFELGEKLLLYAESRKKPKSASVYITEAAKAIWYQAPSVVHTVADIADLYRQFRRAGLVRRFMRTRIERTINKTAIRDNAELLEKKNIRGIHILPSRSVFGIRLEASDTRVVKDIRTGAWHIRWPERRRPYLSRT